MRYSLLLLLRRRNLGCSGRILTILGRLPVLPTKWLSTPCVPLLTPGTVPNLVMAVLVATLNGRGITSEQLGIWSLLPLSFAHPFSVESIPVKVEGLFPLCVTRKVLLYCLTNS